MSRTSLATVAALLGLLAASPAAATPAVHLLLPYDYTPAIQGEPLTFEARLTGADCAGAAWTARFASSRDGALGEAAFDADCVARLTHDGALSFDPHDVTVTVEADGATLTDTTHLTVYPPFAPPPRVVAAEDRAVARTLWLDDPTVVSDELAFALREAGWTALLPLAAADLADDATAARVALDALAARGVAVVALVVLPDGAACWDGTAAATATALTDLAGAAESLPGLAGVALDLRWPPEVEAAVLPPGGGLPDLGALAGLTDAARHEAARQQLSDGLAAARAAGLETWAFFGAAAVLDARDRDGEVALVGGVPALADLAADLDIAGLSFARQGGSLDFGLDLLPLSLDVLAGAVGGRAAVRIDAADAAEAARTSEMCEELVLARDLDVARVVVRSGGLDAAALLAVVTDADTCLAAPGVSVVPLDQTARLLAYGLAVLDDLWTEVSGAWRWPR